MVRVFLLLALLMPAPLAGQWGSCGAKKDQVLLMGRKIEKELPIGSTEMQVTKSLGEMQLQPGPVHLDRQNPIRRYRKLRQTGVTVETPAHNEPALYLEFYFDKRGRLVESVITNACGLGCYSIRQKTSGVLRDVCH